MRNFSVLNAARSERAGPMANRHMFRLLAMAPRGPGRRPVGTGRLPPFKKRVFWHFWGIWEHFHDLERIFTKNSDFPGPSPGRPVVRQVVLPPSPTLASPARHPRTYLDVSAQNTSSEGPWRGWRGWGRGVAPPASPLAVLGWDLENRCFENPL